MIRYLVSGGGSFKLATCGWAAVGLGLRPPIREEKSNPPWAPPKPPPPPPPPPYGFMNPLFIIIIMLGSINIGFAPIPP